MINFTDKFTRYTHHTFIVLAYSMFSPLNASFCSVWNQSFEEENREF